MPGQLVLLHSHLANRLVGLLWALRILTMIEDGVSGHGTCDCDFQVISEVDFSLYFHSQEELTGLFIHGLLDHLVEMQSYLWQPQFVPHTFQVFYILSIVIPESVSVFDLNVSQHLKKQREKIYVPTIVQRYILKKINFDVSQKLKK